MKTAARFCIGRIRLAMAAAAVLWAGGGCALEDVVLDGVHVGITETIATVIMQAILGGGGMA